MVARRASLIVATALAVALAVAPSALAQAPPMVLGPADGASFVQGAPIQFTAFDDAPVVNPHVYVHISASTTTDTYGVIGWDKGFQELTRSGTSYSTTWLHSDTLSPGTYFWQIYRTDDTPCWPDCYYEAGIRSMTITAVPQPPPTLTAPPDYAPFIAGDPITFTAHDAKPGAYVYVVVSTSPVTDGGGSLNPDVYSAIMTGGPDFTNVWTGSGTRPAGTYYWQVYRSDCVAQPDCKVESATRQFLLATPPAPLLTAPHDLAIYARGDPITFLAYDGKPGAVLTLLVSNSPATDGDGLIGPDVLSTSMTGGPSFSRIWSETDVRPEGTYYWQVYRPDCAAQPDCYVESTVRQFTLAPPPPTLTLPANFADYYAGEEITFSAHDAAPGAALTLLISTSSATDGAGVIGHDVLLETMTGGPDFTRAWTAGQPAGTYYWQVYRSDCATQPDCKVQSAVREFDLVPPAAPPPALVAPANGATFHIGDPVTFTVEGLAGQMMWLHVSTSPVADVEGVIPNDAHIGPMLGGPTYSTTVTFPSWQPPDTYYWQAFRIDCSTPSYPDCLIESPIRQLTLTPPVPPPTLTSPGADVKFLAGDPITFTAHDAAPGASLTLLVSASSATDGAGVLGQPVLSQPMSGGPDFSLNWTQTGPLAPGTYHWQVYRSDCATQPDCKVESAVRDLTLQAGRLQLTAPAGDAVFHVGDPITFSADGSPGQNVFMHVSKSPAQDADGVIASDVTIMSMSGGPTYSATWNYSSLQAPGTYYWQAFRIDCSTQTYPDCDIESAVRSFRLEAKPVPPPVTYPAPTPLLPLDGARLKAGVPITFTAADPKPDPDTFLLISASPARDADGLIDGDSERKRLSGASPFAEVWTGTDEMPRGGTLYWQVYRDDCTTTVTTGCRRAGPVRRLTILASTARISVASRCYREGALVPVSGRGFKSRARIDVGFTTGKTVVKTADTAGRFTVKVRAPAKPSTPGSALESLDASEQGNRANAPSKQVRVVAIGISVSPATNVRPGQTVRFKFSGFPRGRVLFAHYLIGGRVRGHQALGRLTGSCGNLTTRRPLIPAGISRTGTWTVQFDARSSYSARTRPRLRERIRVWTVRTSGAAAISATVQP